MSDRSIYFDRYGILQINAYACKIDKSTLPSGPSSNSTLSPYFGPTEKRSETPVCSLMDGEAVQYGYKIPSTPAKDSATSEKRVDDIAEMTTERKSITFRPLFTTGLSTNGPIRSCIKSKHASPSMPRKTVKFKIDSKPFTRGVLYQRDPIAEHNLRQKLNNNVPKATHRSALTSSKQYPDPQSRYIFNKYAHLFGLSRKPEFNLDRSQTETE